MPSSVPVWNGRYLNLPRPVWRTPMPQILWKPTYLPCPSGPHPVPLLLCYAADTPQVYNFCCGELRPAMFPFAPDRRTGGRRRRDRTGGGWGGRKIPLELDSYFPTHMPSSCFYHNYSQFPSWKKRRRRREPDLPTFPDTC